MRRTTTPDALGTILSIWAHPDDETYLAGGVMAAARDRGQRVVCATASVGERGTDDPAGWPPERLAGVRALELAAAMRVLGVDEHVLGGFPDGELAACDAAGVAWAGQLIDAVRPDTILTFGADGVTFHPDHVAVHRWVTAAWLARRRACRLLYAVNSADHLDRYGALLESWKVFMSPARPTGVARGELALAVRLSGADLDRKVVALRTMASQTAGVVAGLGHDDYASFVADETFVDAVASQFTSSASIELRRRPTSIARSVKMSATSDR